MRNPYRGNNGGDQKRPRIKNVGTSPFDKKPGAPGGGGSSIDTSSLRLWHDPLQVYESGERRWGVLVVSAADPGDEAKSFEFSVTDWDDRAMGMAITDVNAVSGIIKIRGQYNSEFDPGVTRFKIEGNDQAGNNIEYGVASRAYDSATDVTSITLDAAITQSAVHGRISWVIVDAVRDTARDDLTDDPTDGESGSTGAKRWRRVITIPIPESHTATIKYRVRVDPVVSGTEYIAGSHTFDWDNNPNLINFRLEVNAFGEGMIFYEGSEDVGSIKWISQTSPFDPVSNDIAADVLAGPNLHDGRTSLDDSISDAVLDGVSVGNTPIIPNETLFVAMMAYQEVSAGGRASGPYYMNASIQDRNTISYRYDVHQYTVTEAGADVAYGRLDLFVNDPYGQLSAVAYRLGASKNILATDSWLTDVAASTSSADNITTLDQSGKWFRVSGDQTERYFTRDRVGVSGSTGNNGTYTVSSSVYDDINGWTTITVLESIPSAVADGAIAPPDFYRFNVKITEGHNSTIQFRITSEDEPPIIDGFQFDFDRIPRIKDVDTWVEYNTSTGSFELNWEYTADEDTESVKILFSNTPITLTEIDGSRSWDGSWDTPTGNERLLTASGRSGVVNYASGGAVAAGSALVIPRGLRVYWAMIGLNATAGTRSADALTGSVVVSDKYPAIDYEYSQGGGYGSVTVTIVDAYNLIDRSDGVSFQYKAGAPKIDGAGWTDAGTAWQAAGANTWTVTSGNILLDSKYPTELQWRVNVRDGAFGNLSYGDSHAFDVDRIPNFKGDPRIWVENGTPYFQFQGDEDVAAVALCVQKTTSSTASLTNIFDLLGGQAGDLDDNYNGSGLPNYFNVQSGQRLRIPVSGVTDVDFLHAYFKVLPSKVGGYSDVDQVSDVIGEVRGPITYGATSVVAPTFYTVPSQDRSDAVVDLYLKDPQGLVTAVEYSAYDSPDDGYGAFSAMTDNGGGHYSASVNTLVLYNVSITVRVSWAHPDGTRYITETHRFDADRNPDHEAEPRIYLDGSNQPTIVWDVDEDGTGVYINTSTSGFPSTDGTYYAGNTGSQAFAAITEGQVFFARIVPAYNVGGTIRKGKPSYKSTQLPAYTSAPLGLAPVQLQISDGNVFLNYIGGISVAGVYYTTGAGSSPADPTTSDSYNSGQTGFFDTGLDLTAGQVGYVKFVASDGATPTPGLGDVYELIITRDDNTAPSLYNWFPEIDEASGDVIITINADDDTDEIYYEKSTASSPAGPITTADSALGGGTGRYVIHNSLTEGETLFVRMAGYSTLQTQFGEEILWQVTRSIKPGFKSYDLAVYEQAGAKDQAQRPGGAIEFDYVLNSAATSIKWGVSVTSFPGTTPNTDSDGQIDFAQFKAAETDLNAWNGLIEGKGLYLVVIPTGPDGDGDTIYLRTFYGRGDTIEPIEIIEVDYSGHNTGVLTLKIKDPQGRVQADPTFDLRQGASSWSTGAPHDSKVAAGTLFTYTKSVTLDPLQDSHIRYSYNWIDSEGNTYTTTNSVTFDTSPDADVQFVNMYLGEFDRNTNLFPVFADVKVNKNTKSIAYTYGLSGALSAGAQDLSGPATVTLNLGSYNFGEVVELHVTPYTLVSGGGEPGTTDNATINTGYDPQDPPIGDGKLKPAALANPPFTPSLTIAYVSTGDPPVYTKNQMTISGSVSYPTTAGPATVNITNGSPFTFSGSGPVVLDKDPESLTYGQLSIGGPDETHFLIGWISEGADVGDPPAWSGVGTEVLMSSIYFASASLDAFLARITDLTILKEIDIGVSGRFISGTDANNGIIIEQGGVFGKAAGATLAKFDAATGSFIAGVNESVRLDGGGLSITLPGGGAMDDTNIDWTWADSTPLDIGVQMAGGVPDYAYLTSDVDMKLQAIGQDMYLTAEQINLVSTSGIVVTGDIISPTNQNIRLIPQGTGDLYLKYTNWPSAAGTAHQVLRYNASGTALEWGNLFNLTHLDDVTGTPVDGYVLSYTGGELNRWQPKSVASIAVPPTRTITIDADGTLLSITESETQDLSANRTWTLTLNQANISITPQQMTGGLNATDGAILTYNQAADRWEVSEGVTGWTNAATNEIITGSWTFNTGSVGFPAAPFSLGSWATGLVAGLNSDYLDGQHGTYYLDYNNFTNKPSSFTPSGSMTLNVLSGITRTGAATQNLSASPTYTIGVDFSALSIAPSQITVGGALSGSVMMYSGTGWAAGQVVEGVGIDVSTTGATITVTHSAPGAGTDDRFGASGTAVSGIVLDSKGHVVTANFTAFATQSAFDSHTTNTSNPHNVTKAQVGLGSVQNIDITQYEFAISQIAGGGAGLYFLQSSEDTVSWQSTLPISSLSPNVVTDRQFLTSQNGATPTWNSFVTSYISDFAESVQDLVVVIVSDGVGAGLESTFTINPAPSITITHAATRNGATLFGSTAGLSGNSVLTGFYVDQFGHVAASTEAISVYTTTEVGNMLLDYVSWNSWTNTLSPQYYTKGQVDGLITGFVTDQELSDGLATKANVSHNQDASTILNLASAITSEGNLHYSQLGHAHDAGDVTSGAFDNARISSASVLQHLSAGAGLSLTGGAFAHADTSAFAGLTITTGSGNVVGSVSVDTYGHVQGVGTRPLVAADIPNLTSAKITDFNNAVIDLTSGQYATLAHANSTLNPHNVTAAQVGLGNVEDVALSSWTVPVAQIAPNGPGDGAMFLRVTSGGPPFWGTLDGSSHSHIAANITDFANAAEDYAGNLVVAGTGNGSGLTASYATLTNTLTLSHAASRDGNTLFGASSGLNVLRGFYVDQFGHVSASAETVAVAAATHSHDVSDLIGGGAGTLFLRSVAGAVSWGVAGSVTGSFTFVTAQRLSGSDLQHKTRTVTVDGGIVTSIGAESAWTTYAILP